MSLRRDIQLRVPNEQASPAKPVQPGRVPLFIGIGLALVIIAGAILLMRPGTAANPGAQKSKTTKSGKNEAATATDAPDERMIETLVSRLDDTALRADAENQLIAIGVSAVPALAKAVTNNTTRFGRLEAAQTLGRIDDPSALAAIEAALKNNSDLDLVAAVYPALVRQGSPEREGLLIKALDTYGRIEMAADFIASENPSLRTAGTEWARVHRYELATLPVPTHPPKWGERGPKQGSSDTPQDSRALVGALIAELQDRIARPGATVQLGDIGTPAVGPLLQTMRQDPNRLVRLAAIEALSYIQDPQAEEALRQLLKTADLDMVAAAYRYVIRKGEPDTESTLISALNSNGDFQMAQDFEHSGNPRLKAAAEGWVKQKRYAPVFGAADADSPVWGGRSTPPAAAELALFHFDNSALGASGLPPTTAAKVAYAPGKWGSALALPPGGELMYPIDGDLDLQTGTIEMWIAPRVDGNDSVYSNGDNILLVAQASNGAEFILSESQRRRFYGGEIIGGNFIGADGGNMSTWRAGQWHHVAFTYSSARSRQRLYIDGLLVRQNSSSLPPLYRPPRTFAVDCDGHGHASAFLVDELRTSKNEKNSAAIRADAIRQRAFDRNEADSQ